jgi:hypothetical protein
MSTTLTINLPNEWWYSTTNTPLSAFFNYIFNNSAYDTPNPFIGFTPSYTTSDLSASCSFSNSTYTVDYLTIQFTINNPDNKSYVYYNDIPGNTNEAYYWNWCQNMNMKISAKINGSTSTNLVFLVSSTPSFDILTNELTLNGGGQINNTSPSNTIFSSSNSKVYLNSSKSSEVILYNSTQTFPIIIDINPPAPISTVDLTA